MGRRRIEKNIYYDDKRKCYYVVFNFGKDPITEKQIKPNKTFDKLTQARAALRQHEAARDRGQVVIPKKLTLASCGTIPSQILSPLFTELRTSHMTLWAHVGA